MSTVSTTSPPLTLTPAEFGRRYGIGISKVLSWLASGELTGIDVSLGRKEKPRWRIRLVDIEQFEARRCNAPAPKRRTSHRPAATKGVFFSHQ